MAININHQNNEVTTSNSELDFQDTMMKNVNVERVASDPNITVSGRVWYNTTDKHVKMSAINDNGQLVIKQIPIKDDVDSALAQALAYVDQLKLQDISNVNGSNGLNSGDVLVYSAMVDQWLVTNYLAQQVVDAGEF